MMNKYTEVNEEEKEKTERVTTGAMRAHSNTHVHAHFIIDEIVGGNGSLDHTRTPPPPPPPLSLRQSQEETCEQHNFSFKPLK